MLWHWYSCHKYFLLDCLQSTIVVKIESHIFESNVLLGIKMLLDKIPEVDMVTVAQRSNVERRGVLGFVPRIGLPIVDYAEVDRIDAFYLECQNFRDYYRDPYDRVHKPLMFTKHMGKCGIKIDQSVEELRQPISWVQRKKPLTEPVNYKTHMNLGVDINTMIRGRYGKQSCIRYKR